MKKQAEEGYNVKVWRLIESDYSWEWDKAWEINMASIGIGFESVPMAINNFDVDIIYLWSLQHIRYVACNVRTQTKYLGPINRANEKYLPCNISVCFYPGACEGSLACLTCHVIVGKANSLFLAIN